jgi:hypothetical protein
VKKIAFVLLLSIFIPNFFSPLLAVNSDYNQSYEDYLHNYNQYREAHGRYVTAKNQYLAYQTLSAKNKALIATREMLDKRSESLKTFIAALRIKLGEETNVVGSKTNDLYRKLDEEANWLQNHQEALSSAATLEDLLNLSEEFEAKYPQTEIIIYQSLAEVLKGKEIKLYEQARKLLEETSTIIEEVKKEDTEKAILLERWLTEANKKEKESYDKITTADDYLVEVEPGKKLTKAFSQTQFSLKESNQFLKEVAFYLDEIIQKIKYD